MPRTPAQFEEIRSEKRALIMETALKLFANQGYSKTSISQIAREADISKGLMYNYFDSKESLLKSILNELADEFSKNIDPNKDKIITEEEALNFVDFTFDLINNKRDALKCYYQLFFQPEVNEILSKNNIINKTIIEQQVLFINYLKSRNANIDSKIAKANILSFFRGFFISYVFYPKMYTQEFLQNYKEYLKERFIRIKY